MTVPTMTEEQLAAVKRDMQLEIDARLAKLQAICDAQCESLQARLNRRLNRIPAAQRQISLNEIVSMHCKVNIESQRNNGSVHSTTAAIATATTATTTATTSKKPVLAPVPAPAYAPAPPARKTKSVPAASAPKKAAKAAVTKPAAKAAAKPATAKSVRGTKRSSDDATSDDKENAQDLALPKKRVRAAVQKAPAPSKPATVRTTRAASRQKPTSGHVLSPKTGNASARQKAATTSTARPR